MFIRINEGYFNKKYLKFYNNFCENYNKTLCKEKHFLKLINNFKIRRNENY